MDSLLKADLNSLSREAAEIGVAAKNVRDNVGSMDWDHVPRPLVIRYLLMHAYRAIENSPRLYERWLHVLSKYVASAAVLDKVRQRLDFPTSCRPTQVSANAMFLAEGIANDIAVSNEPNRLTSEETIELKAGAKQPHIGNVLRERHISVLTEILIACAAE